MMLLLVSRRLRPSASALSIRDARALSSLPSHAAPLKTPRANSPFAVPQHQTRLQEQQDARWREFVLALRTFHSLERHFAVPPRFVVPAPSLSPLALSRDGGSEQEQQEHEPPQAAKGSDANVEEAVPHYLRHESWPKELHGLTLGVRVFSFVRAAAEGTLQQSAEQLAELQELGFPLHHWREYVFETATMPALATYKEIEGHLFVPQKFVVPHGDLAWPRPTWGVPLGKVIMTLRRQRDEELPDDHVAALTKLGFVWNVSDAKWFQFVLPGLRAFKAIHGSTDVPLAFVVPKQESEGASAWPRHLRGYRLGQQVCTVRRGFFTSQVEESREELEALGFSFSVSDTMWSHTIFPALQVFARAHHHCDVPQDFVVPASPPWPEKAWRVKLGQTVQRIRKGAYEAQTQAHQKELEQLGFVWNAQERRAITVRQVVLPALATYRELHGHVLVSTDFVVPKNDAVWPKPARGFRLGYWITRVRAGIVDLPDHLRSELDAVGFVWRVNDARWNEILLPSLEVYAELHGSCKAMNTKFRVPHEPPYPEKAWGISLGLSVWHMRNGDTYVNDDVKLRELKRLGVL
ncbi:hypothetical protein PybrP1_009640 [[Pythium] brassicae (nom. inval.)]|nr:hypothetical protein PybrP1_009640 [[Pythium] brassicae (nom. inval.)]